MRLSILYPLLVALLTLSEPSHAARKPANSVLLSSVSTLTLRKDAKTSARRVSAIPQLKCIGGNGKGHYEVDVMRCKSQGSDYDDDNIQWTCTASLPEEFRLGATDVICEGYDSPNDPYILKGSCGVEYRLMLTPRGEEKYGKGGFQGIPKLSDNFSRNLFLLVFVGIAGWIIYGMYQAWLGNQGAGRPRQPRRGGGFGGWSGGGGGGGGGDRYDPPPPYPGKPSTAPGAAAQETWRPGFWSGLAGGAAAGYMAGNRGQRQRAPPERSSWFGNSDNGWGAGPSTRPATRSSSSFNSSARHESTGFGGTSRR